MKVRKLAVALALAGGLGSNFSYALGMGEARIDSSLNQPLRAEIELVRPGDISRDQIRATIASASDFERAGVERMGVLRNVELQVVRNDNGDLVIQVTSDSPIREPFLNFLVELTWPSGRLMREYSFLVDPPDYREAPASSGPVAPSAPASAEPEGATSPSASRERQPQPESQPDRVRDEQARQDTRSVRSGDNLWSIAGEVRPARDMTREQVMLALQDLNPDAFLGNNINRLRGDAVLRLPSEEQIRSRSPQQARQSVQQQHQAFAERSAAPEDQPLAESTDESPLSSPAEAQTAQGGDELKLVVDDPESSREGSVGGTGIGEGDAELTLALEELDRADREREELSERLAEMESQVQTLSQLVQLKDDQMAELQAQLAAAQQEAPEQEDSEPEQEGSEPEQEGSAAATPGESNGDAAVSEPEPETEPELSLSEQVSSALRTNPYVQIGAGSLGLALLALLLVLARRNARKDEAALSGAGQESEDLLDLSESRIGDPSVGDSDDARTGADAFDSMEPSESGSLELEEEDENPLSMDDLERQLKTGDSGSGTSKENSQAVEEEGFDLDWDSDTDEPGDDEPDDESEQPLDFSSVESDQEEDQEEVEEAAKTEDDFNFDLDELGEDESDSNDEEDESLSFTLDEDFDLSDTDSEDGRSGDDDEPLSDEDLATLGLDDDEESSLSDLPEDTQDESDTAQEAESSKHGESPQEASPESAAAFASGSSDEEDFDDSFLEELDAELDKVTGDDKDEPELGKVAENMDDLELDLSEDDLALMEDSDDKSVEPESLSEDESDMDDVPDLSNSELDETLGEGDLEEASELSEEESEALSGAGMDLEEPLDMGDEDQPREESESGEKAAKGSQSSADGSPPADGSSPADGSDFDDSLLEEAAGVDLNEEEDEFDFLEGTDESGTKLDLARAYVEMGDADGAREILQEVAAEGSDVQQKEARKLLDEL